MVMNDIVAGLEPPAERTGRTRTPAEKVGGEDIHFPPGNPDNPDPGVIGINPGTSPGDLDQVRESGTEDIDLVPGLRQETGQVINVQPAPPGMKGGVKSRDQAESHRRVQGSGFRVQDTSFPQIYTDFHGLFRL
jgi:hypothetical protein